MDRVSFGGSIRFDQQDNSQAFTRQPGKIPGDPEQVAIIDLMPMFNLNQRLTGLLVAQTKNHVTGFLIGSTAQNSIEPDIFWNRHQRKRAAEGAILYLLNPKPNGSFVITGAIFE